MANITFQFQYDLPDEYLHQTSELGLKADWTYNGPDKFYIFVDKETGLLEWSMGTMEWNKKDPAGSEELAKIKAGLAREAILLIAEEEPLVASFFQMVDQSTLPQKEYKINDVVYYSRSEPTTPEHTYEVGEVTYDFETASWNKPFNWKKPHITMEQHNQVRLNIIAGVNLDLEDEDLDPALRTKLEEFKTELEEIPTKFEGWSPWQIPFPNDPRIEPVE